MHKVFLINKVDSKTVLNPEDKIVSKIWTAIYDHDVTWFSEDVKVTYKQIPFYGDRYFGNKKSVTREVRTMYFNLFHRFDGPVISFQGTLRQLIAKLRKDDLNYYYNHDTELGKWEDTSRQE